MNNSIISVANESDRITDDETRAMIHSIGIQLARDVAPIWGQVPALEFVPRGQASNGIPCVISDTPDFPGAAGYHYEDENGTPQIKVFTFPGGLALVGPNSVSVTLSHEILEVVGDMPANKWADGPDGNDYAYELCDAVEGDTYEIDGVTVSNFVYPAFFDPQAPIDMKLAHMNTVSMPFTMSSGGYQIKRTEPGNVSQIFASARAGYDVHKISERLAVVFGPEFPESMKAGKVAKVARRRGNKAL